MPKKFIGEPFCAVFQKTSGSEKFMDKRGGEYQDLPLIIFCLTVQKKIRRATILCSTEIPVSKKFMEERGGYQDFLSKSFCLTVPKRFVGDSISVSLFSGIDNLYTSEG